MKFNVVETYISLRKSVHNKVALAGHSEYSKSDKNFVYSRYIVKQITFAQKGR